MQANEARRPFSARTVAFRLSLFYGTLFLTVGLLAPYWSLWLKDQGMGPSQIGLLLAGSYIARTFSIPAAGVLVDRYGDRRLPMLALAAASLCAYTLFLFAGGFWPLMVLTIFAAASFSPIAPLGDSLTMLKATELDLDYGRIRLWGSLTFIAASTLGGAVLQRHSTDALLWFVIATLAAVIGACVMLPGVYGDRQGRRAAPGDRTLRRLLAQPRFLLFLAVVSLIQISHLVYYGFGALHWQAAGMSIDVVGLLWAEGVLAESILLAASGAMLRRMGPARLLMLAGLAAALRWTMLGLTTEPIILVFVQTLHAFSFGACYVGAVDFIDRAAPRSASAGAQALCAAVATAMLPGVAMLFIGRLFQMLGGSAFFLAAAAGLLAATLAMALERCWSGGLLMRDEQPLR